MIHPDTLTKESLAALIDHTNLKAFATREDLRKLCKEASDNHFKMVAINSVQVPLGKELLQGSGVHVGAAVSFPLGQTSIAAKLFETKDALENGADEIDYVINITELKRGNFDYLQREMEGIVALCREKGALSKVIFENCYLEKSEIEAMARLALKVKPDFIKTSTGFGTGGATPQDVKLMADTVGDEVLVKAAGGIRSWADARAMLLAGASRLGTSAGVKILEEFLAAK